MRITLHPFLLPAVLPVALLCAGPARAQATLPDLDRRVTTLERDMRAVRRLVLPGGRVVEPEVDTGAPAPAAPAASGGPAPPLGALTERVDALERQQRRLTAQIEEQDFKLRQIERALADLRTAQARLEAAALAPAAAAPDAGPASGTTPPAATAATRPAGSAPAASAPAAAAGTRPAGSATAPPAVPAPAASTGARPSGSGTPPPAATRPAEARPVASAPAASADARFAQALEHVRAGDWAAAESAMAAFARANPRHAQASLARYWAGRAQHNQGRFEAAARTHFDNYQADQRGSHAQHSLYWVGQALVRLNRAPEACQVYTLAQRVYAEDMLSELRPQFAQARRTAGCQG